MRHRILLRGLVAVVLLASVVSVVEAPAAPLRISRALATDTTASLLPAGPGARNIETSSAVVPPGADPVNCPSGRLFVSNAGRWLTQVDLSPTGIAPTTQKVTHLDTLIPAGQLVASRPVKGACQFDWGNFQFDFTGAGDDTHVLRVGPKPGSLIVAFTGYHQASVGLGNPPLAAAIVVGGKTLAPAGACSWTANAVNFLARTDDCGQTWQPANVTIDNGPADAVNGPFPAWCGNMDQTMLHRDPFSSGHEIYAYGGTGKSCAGGVDGSFLYRSDDEGLSWKRVHLFEGMALYTPSLTSTPSGILAVFGCTGSGTAVLAYSYDRGASFQLQELGSLEVACQAPAVTPDNLCINSPTATSISFAKTSEDGMFDVVRLLYPHFEQGTESPGKPRIVYRMYLAYLRQQFVPGLPAPLSSEQDLVAETPGASILRASFIEPDGFGVPGTPRSTLLWWEEGALSKYRTFYRVLTGLDTSSETYPLSVKGGASEEFLTLFAFQGSCRFVGDYDRGSFYQAAGGPPRFLAQWSEGHVGSNIVVRDAIVHFNTVEVEVPTFSDWSALGGSLALSASPAAVSTAPGTIEVFSRATDGSVESLRSTDGAWEANPRKWDGTIQGAPAVVARGDGRIDVFGVGLNDHMWHQSIHEGSIETSWMDLGGEFKGQPGAASTGSGLVTVFGTRKIDGQVLARSWNGEWGEWVPVSDGMGIKGVSAVSWGPGRIDVFVIGLNGHVWHYGSDQGTAVFPGEWEDLGGSAMPVVPPAVTSDAPGRLHVFIAHADRDGSIDYRRYDGEWGDWVDLGGGTYTGQPATAGPTAVVTTAGGKLLHLFVRGLDGRLWEKTSADGL